MITLSQYIYGYGTDGHIHLFDHDMDIDLESISDKLGFDTYVGFEDINFKHLNKYSDGKTLDHYRSYINNHSLDNVILCATGIDSTTIIKTYEEFPDVIRGFGELKCYGREMHGKKLPYENLKWVSEILEYDDQLGDPLPVIIHYNLDNLSKIKKFGDLLNRYPDIPIVLCHCGMPGPRYDSALDDNDIFWAAQQMQQIHQNLWLDISYSALDFLNNSPCNIYSLDRTRTYIGSDITPCIYKNSGEDKYLESVQKKLKNIFPHIQSDQNIRNLFGEPKAKHAI